MRTGRRPLQPFRDTLRRRQYFDAGVISEAEYESVLTNVFSSMT
jgi:hypothetical protein